MLDGFARAVRRRSTDREPVAYILSRRGFRVARADRRPRALIPRPETEHLVESALGLPAGWRVLDVGTGCGAGRARAGRRAPRPERRRQRPQPRGARARGRELGPPRPGGRVAARRPAGGGRGPTTRPSWPTFPTSPRRERASLAPRDLAPRATRRPLRRRGRAERDPPPGGPAGGAPGGALHRPGGGGRAGARGGRAAARSGFEKVRSERDLAGIERVVVGERLAWRPGTGAGARMSPS